MNELIPLETEGAPFGKVKAIHCRAGERTYFLVDRKGGITLLPSEVLEAHIELNDRVDS